MNSNRAPFRRLFGAPVGPSTTGMRNQINNLVLSLASTGIVDEKTETVDLVRLAASTLQVKAVASAYFDNDLTGVYSFPEQTLDLNAVLTLSDGLYIRHVHITKAGVIEFLAQRDVSSPQRLAIGVIYLQVVGGVVTMPAELPPLARPAIAGVSSYDLAVTGLSLSVSLLPLADLSISCTSGEATGESINWANRNSIHRLPVAAADPLSMRRIYAGLASQTSVPPTSTTVDPAQYWNGTALVPVGGGVTRATVQRMLWSPGAGFSIQYGEAFFATLAQASNAMAIAPFSSVFPGAEGIEIARIAITRACTSLRDATECVFQFSPGIAGAGGTPPPEIQRFDANGTFVKPTGATSIQVFLIGGGAGGASGAVSAPGATAAGGGGGGGAARTEFLIDASLMADTCAVLVGAAGVGGAASTGFSNPGTDGGVSQVTNGLASYRANGGLGSTGVGSGQAANGLFAGGAGGAGGGSSSASGNSGSGTLGGTTTSFGGGGPGGGGGAGLTSANAEGPGGAAAFSTTHAPPGLSPGGSGGAAGGGDGLDAATSPGYASFRYPGVSGGGGGSNLTGNGGKGGNAGGHGAGGGGGGAARTGSSSGAGGNGSPGVVIFVIYF